MPIIPLIKYNKMIAEEKYALLISSSTDDESHLGRLISYLFSNQYLYTHSSFRRLIESDRKGYIGLHLLLQIEPVRRYFDELGLNNQRYEVIYLKTAIRTYCSELHYHDDRVRRVIPWNKKTILNTKPFSIHHLEQKIGISDIRSYFGEESFVRNEEEGKSICVYSQNWREKMEGMDKQSLPFSISDYSVVCRDQARTVSLWQLNQLRIYHPLSSSLQSHKKDEYRACFIQPPRRHPKMQHRPYHREAYQTPEQSAAFALLIRSCNPNHNELLLSSSFPNTFSPECHD